MKSIIAGPDFTPRTLTFGEVKCFSYNKDLKSEIAGKVLTKEDAIFMFRQMVNIRAFEEMIIRLRSGELVPYEGYKFSGATHLSIGQEAVPAGAMAALKGDDYITSSHRGHGHGIAKESYALRDMDKKGLQDFVGAVKFKSTKKDLLEQAIDVHLYRTMTEFMGKEDGYCRGRGGGMHIADFNVGHLGANAIVGGSLPMATGAGMSSMFQDDGKVTVCFFGDGASNNGVFCESLNMACMGQFADKGVPVIFLLENNQFGMTGRTRNEITGLDFLARRGWAYNDKGMHAEVVNGMDALAVRDAVSRAAEKCRNGQGPALLEVMTYRYMGHSLSDQNLYRQQEEIEMWRCEDAIERMKVELVKAGLDPTEPEEIEKQIYKDMEEITIAAAKSDFPDPSTLMEGLYSNSTTETVPAEYKTTDYNKEFVKDYRDGKGCMPYRRAVQEALTEEMIRDKRVVVYGEDVAEHGGAFAATAGLFETFGRKRVFNAPISEVAICGSAVGMAMTGMRPVIELMYIDFILMSMDQLGNQAAKNKYMFGGKAKMPLVCRTTIGGGKGYAGQHSQSLEAAATMIPGLKVVAPSTPGDVKGLLKTAIRDDNAVIFIEHQLLYGDRGEVPAGDYTIPFGKAAIRREGSDVTIVSYSYMANEAIKAADLLAADGISAEVIDLRSLIPMDTETVLKSVQKTNYGVVACQACTTNSFGEHIAYEIQNKAFDYLDAPVELVGAPDIPPPMAPTLEAAFMPNAAKIAARVKTMLGK
ncbi:MAG: dehydrogenase E1 component subunit alpha/beta [Sedimentisphaerales bacterium]|nr:dehydrogenase E1 component subunit alpha/beta [Sedimentisphaerales bacterium]